MKKFKSIYEHKYKTLLWIPFIILILAIVQIGAQYATTGDFVHKGISLKGGSTITIPTSLTDVQMSQIENSLKEYFTQGDISLRKLTSAGITSAIAIDSDAQEDTEIQALILKVEELTNIQKKEYTVERVGSSLGDQFFTQTLFALGIAFVLMGIVVFIYFRTTVPSLAVILAAASDIIITLAVFNLTGMKLSSAGIAAFLMLIGYSVDTDIMLSSRMLRRKQDTIMQRVYGALRTGLTMSATTISAVLVAFLLAKSDVVKQIMVILLIGLITDLIMTWIQNVGILRIYLEKKEHKK
jgi:preprotein translocase subunit SecF